MWWKQGNEARDIHRVKEMCRESKEEAKNEGARYEDRREGKAERKKCRI
jgi:hypothetical protein